MKIIISPAKKMKEDLESLAPRGFPVFLEKTERVLKVLQGMTHAELKALWKCSDKIADLNTERLSGIDLRKDLTPALLAYEGIQYQYMAPGVFSEKEFDYAEKHLRILSGFYGILRPFDGVRPYRLEMQAGLSVAGCKDLYAYWGKDVSQELFSETDAVLNLASREYSSLVLPHKPQSVRFVTAVFGEEKNGKVVEKGTMCKMARGEMVRFLAETGGQKPEDARSFDRLGFCFSQKHSAKDTLVFLRDGNGQNTGKTAWNDREYY